jgi:hypothetical protein
MAVQANSRVAVSVALGADEGGWLLLLQFQIYIKVGVLKPKGHFVPGPFFFFLIPDYLFTQARIKTNEHS